MNLQQAKETQIAIMKKLGYGLLRTDDEDGYPRFRRGKVKNGAKLPLIGVGITVPDKQKKSGYGILLTCQRKADLKSPIVTFARERAGKELTVVYTGRARLAARKAKKKPAGQATKPVLIGDSVGLTGTQGSIGCFVSLRDEAGVFVLSNNHVLADINNAAVGANILSPTPSDGNDEHIADLHSFHPLDPDGDNLVDCAVGKMRAGVNFDGQMVHDLPGAAGPVAISGNVVSINSLAVGQKVRRVGRSSNKSGHVFALNQSIELDGILFFGQICIKGNNGPFVKDGDSGSVAFNDAMDAVGLVVGFDDAFSYCNPMKRVLTKLKATML